MLNEKEPPPFSPLMWFTYQSSRPPLLALRLSRLKRLSRISAARLLAICRNAAKSPAKRPARAEATREYIRPIVHAVAARQTGRVVVGCRRTRPRQANLPRFSA